MDTGYMGDGTFYNTESFTARMHNEMNAGTKMKDGTLYNMEIWPVASRALRPFSQHRVGVHKVRIQWHDRNPGQMRNARVIQK